jgi:hypothetical protein
MGGIHQEPHDVRLGGRGKVTDKVTGKDKSASMAVGRLILMLSHRDLLVTGVTEQLLTKAYCSPNYPISIGFGWSHGNAVQMATQLADFPRHFCFDARKFDSSISDWMVDAAIVILRRQFVEGMHPRYDAYWNFVKESLVDVVICRDDGIRMRKSQGTTSGHSHNTLAQSIITLIVGYMALFHLKPHLTDQQVAKFINILSLGDDNLMSLGNLFDDITMNDIIRSAGNGANINWSGKKSFETTRIADATPYDFSGIQYLGKYLRVYFLDLEVGEQPTIIPYRPFQETFERLMFPEREVKSLDKSFERVLGNYYDGAGNPQTEAWLQGLMDWMEAQGAIAPEEFSEDIVEGLTKDYYGIGLAAPPATRINFGAWLLWVTTESNLREYERRTSVVLVGEPFD